MTTNNRKMPELRWTQLWHTPIHLWDKGNLYQLRLDISAVMMSSRQRRSGQDIPRHKIGWIQIAQARGIDRTEATPADLFAPSQQIVKHSNGKSD